MKKILNKIFFLSPTFYILFIYGQVQKSFILSNQAVNVTQLCPLQAKILELIAIPFSRGFFQPKDRTFFQPKSPALLTDSLPAELPGKPHSLKVKLAQSCLTLCTPWTVVHGILQARILE